MARPSWHEYFLAIAEVVSRRSTCPRAHVGAVIVSAGNRILATGYNGSPPGEAHCDDIGCLMEDNHCQRTLHAEVNAIAFAARAGVRLQGGRLYIWSSRGDSIPCRECEKVIKAVGLIIYQGEVIKEGE
jgi:dCMP deaminase